MRKNIFLMTMLAAGLSAAAAVECPGMAPGKAVGTKEGSTYTLKNEVLEASFAWKDGGVVFGGLKAADGTELVQGGGAVFHLSLADGTQMSSADMTVSAPQLVKLAPEDTLRVAAQQPGQAITATFEAPNGAFTVEWRAVLRDGSHYLRQEYTLKGGKTPVPFATITPLQVVPTADGGIPSISGNTTHGTVVVTDKMFMGLETPMSVMTVGRHGAVQEDTWSPESWTPGMFGSVFAVPESFHPVYGKKYDERSGPVVKNLLVAEGAVKFEEAGDCTIDFRYEKGNNRLNMVGVQLVTSGGQVIAEDIHPGYTGHKSENAEYHVVVPAAGTYHLRYWVEKMTEPVSSSGRISLSLTTGNPEEEATDAIPEDMVRGTWVRKTNLTEATPWKVSSVMGLFAPGQERRSFSRSM